MSNMFKKFAKYDQWHFAEVDPVRLKRMALNLREQIHKKIEIDNDPYLFHSRTMPFVEAAIRGEIAQSLDGDVTKYISGNYKHDEGEGILPSELDREFRAAVAGFSVAIEGLSLEQPQHELVNGVAYAWMNFEEESDWPDKMLYP
jgi:hypothetical protein